MKTMAAVILGFAAVAATAFAYAEEPVKAGDDSDVTIQVMDEGESPTQFSNKIQLPHVSNIVHAGFDKHVDAQLHGASKEAGDTSEAASEHATQSIKDSLPDDGEQHAPEDINDHMDPDQTLLNQEPAEQPGGK